MNREHPDSGRIITSGDVINDLHDTIARREAVIKLLEKDAHDAYTQLANARGTRKVLWNLLGECLPLLKVDAEWSTDYEGKEAIEALIERIESARTAVQAEELPGATP
jgi:hypothetical protein